MSEKLEKKELWVPKQPLEPNIQKMAWYLFLEWWKCYFHDRGDPGSFEGFQSSLIETVYGACIDVAKIARRLEQPEKIPDASE